jgi:hypothetical protein
VPINTDGDTYDEYRQLYLKAPASTCIIGDGDGDGSELVMHDASNVQCAWTVLKSASTARSTALSDHPEGAPRRRTR